MERQTEADRLKSLMRAGMLPVEAVQNCAKLGHEPSLELFSGSKIYWSLWEVRYNFLRKLPEALVCEFAYKCALRVVRDRPKEFKNPRNFTFSVVYPEVVAWAEEQTFAPRLPVVPSSLSHHLLANMAYSPLEVPPDEYYYSRALRAMGNAFSATFGDTFVNSRGLHYAVAATDASRESFLADSKKASYEWQQAMLAQLILKPYL